MKRGANQQVHVLEQIEHEVAVFSRRIRGPAMHEAIEAFRQKRSPDFTNMD